MTLIDTLQQFPILLYSTVAILGCIVGSFLNVVIFRLPPLLDYEWKGYALELLDIERQQEKPDGLVLPRSRCSQCRHQLAWFHNIPIVSYIFLKGRCSQCNTRISIQYPLIELLSGIASLVVVWHFGATEQALFLLILTWALISLSMIDLHTQLLPDIITLPLVWLGLLLSTQNLYVDSKTSIIGAVVGYLSLWSVYKLFKLLTNKEGMGYGDFKLLAVFGAWLGWQPILLIILLSSFVGAIFGIGMIVFAGRDSQLKIPFGPYIAIAGWVAFLWGDLMIDKYLLFSGIG